MKHQVSQAARESLLNGALAVSSVVATTLGPKGHFAVLSGAPPVVTNDGATIASHLKIEDPYEAIGAEIVKQVARGVAQVVGDGTTTATILTTELLRRGIDSRRHAHDVSKELAVAVVETAERLKGMAKPVTQTQLTEVGVRACKDEKLGSTIANLVYQVGEDSHVFIDVGAGLSAEAVKGSVFAAAPLVNQGDVPLPTTPTSAPVLCLDHIFADFQRVIPLVEELMESGQKELVVICDGVDGDALRSIVTNHARGAFSIYAIKVENIKEVALIYGAKLFQPYETVNPSVENLGGGKSIISGDRLVVVDPRGSIDKAIASLRGEKLPKEVVTRRIAQLSGHIGFLTISGNSETEVEDKRIRSDDGIRACQAALRGGVVPGGGMALQEVADGCSSEILAEAMRVIKQIIDANAGEEVPTNGVVDPVLVLTTAIIHSTTAACQLLQAESLLL